MLPIPTLKVKKEFVFNVALKPQTEYLGVKPFAPFTGGVTVFKASKKVELV